MKTFPSTTIAASTLLLAVLSLDAVSAMKSYLAKLPNGDAAFTQELGHSDATTYALTDFGKMFSTADNTWTSDLCTSTFPGTDMTVGAAFGDPCCTWKSGGTPDFKVDPFTTAPKKTECASAATTAPASTTAAPAATTAAPSSSSSAGSASSNSSTPATTTAAPSSATPSPTVTPAGKKCGVKRDAKKPAASSLDDDSGSDDA